MDELLAWAQQLQPKWNFNYTYTHFVLSLIVCEIERPKVLSKVIYIRHFLLSIEQALLPVDLLVAVQQILRAEDVPEKRKMWLSQKIASSKWVCQRTWQNESENVSSGA